MYVVSPLEDEFYNCKTLSEWLQTHVPPELVLSAAKGVTVAMLIDRLEDIARREWSDGIDAMGEDA
jgi:hypothetical protein